MKKTIYALACVLASLAVTQAGERDALETNFRELPMEARRLTGPLFWLHGDANETRERLEGYLEKVAEGGNGCFTAESRPHSDWLGPRWYKDLDICLSHARTTGAHLPVAALVDQFYSQVQKMGGNRWDTSSLLALLERET